MGDFVVDTAVEPIGERRYRAVLSSDWMTWGPAGGYVAAVALRAAGAATAFERPATLSCQFLSVARFAPVELEVLSLRAGRRTEALRVSMEQEGRAILEMTVWAAEEGKGLEHDYTRPPEVAPPEDLAPMEVLDPKRPQRGLFACFERRPLSWHDFDRDGVPEPSEPVLRSWFRFRPRATDGDRFADAARAVILIDTFSWPATWAAHPSSGPSPWIAPNLDLHVRFHHDARPSEWLFGETRADLAAHGLIGTNGSVWSPAGELIAAGSAQLFCRPRPERFR